MKIGVMNNPMRDILREIQWIGENGFDFVDMTLEPPGAQSTKVNIDAIRDLLDKYRLDVVGHTAYYLPIASPYQEFCDLAFEEFRNCFEVFQALDATNVNLHADESSGAIFNREQSISRNIKAIKRIAADANKYGLKLMVENTIRLFNTVDELQTLFNAVDDAEFHLDIGHANLNTQKNKTPEFLANFGDRLAHVHMSDNKSGSADLHLPLGAGLVPWKRMVDELKKHKYDGTITLEVFSRERRYLLASRDILLELWNKS